LFFRRERALCDVSMCCSALTYRSFQEERATSTAQHIETAHVHGPAGRDTAMQLPKFVPILNADSSLYKVTKAVLLGEPQDPALHYEAGKGGKVQPWPCLVDYWRARGIQVPRSACEWCKQGKEPWQYRYLPLLVPDKEGKKYVPAMLQI